MPKKEVDYSNTIIYKIYCRDDTINDVYIGHTTNFIQRKYAHKTACNNSSNALKIYSTIRLNGGWDKWDIIEIAKYNCNITFLSNRMPEYFSFTTTFRGIGGIKSPD